jgi:hypothetical protein
VDSVLAEKRVTLLDRARFNTPVTWQEMSRDITDTLTRYLYFVPFDPAVGTEHSANVSVVVRRVPIGTDTIWANHLVYSRKYTGYVIVNDCKDNAFWKSYLWRAQNNETVYVGLERAGVANGIFVQALLSFPLMGPLTDSLEGTKNVLMIDTAYQTSDRAQGVVLFSDPSMSIIEDFNSLCESIDVDSTSEFNTRFYLYDIPAGNIEVRRPVPDTSK